MSYAGHGYPLPTWTANSVGDIDFKVIKEAGVLYCLLDLDGTFTPTLSMDVCQNAVRNIQTALWEGFIRAACIISNVGVWPLAHRVSAIATKYHLPHHACYWPWPMKPSVKAFEHASALITSDTDHHKFVIIGDQRSDMEATKYGYRTILVPPLGTSTWWNSWKRKMEDDHRRRIGARFPHEL